MAEAPKANARKICYAARDEYFKCLNDNDLWLNGLKPESYDDIIKLDPTQPQLYSKSDKDIPIHKKNTLFICENMKLFYEKNCLPSWSFHFAMLRVANLQKDAMMKKLDEKNKERDTTEFWEKASLKVNK